MLEGALDVPPVGAQPCSAQHTGFVPAPGEQILWSGCPQVAPWWFGTADITFSAYFALFVVAIGFMLTWARSISAPLVPIIFITTVGGLAFGYPAIGRVLRRRARIKRSAYILTDSRLLTTWHAGRRPAVTHCALAQLLPPEVRDGSVFMNLAWRLAADTGTPGPSSCGLQPAPIHRSSSDYPPRRPSRISSAPPSSLSAPAPGGGPTHPSAEASRRSDQLTCPATCTSAASVTFPWLFRASRSIRWPIAHPFHREARINHHNRIASPLGVAAAATCDGCDARRRASRPDVQVRAYHATQRLTANTTGTTTL